MMLLGNWDHDPEDDFKRKWKRKELRQPIKWTGPSLSAKSPLKARLNLAPTKAEIEEHQRAWKEADTRYIEEQLRKLPLLAQEYGIDTPGDAWVGIVERNDVWVLGLLLAFARKVVPGFRLDFGSRRGSRKWNEGAQAELIADIEAEKHRRQEQGRGKCSDLQACLILVSTPRYRGRYGDVSPKQSQDKRARSLRARLVDARKAKTLVTRLLANADGELKRLLTDRLISLFACDAQEAASAQTRYDALLKELEEPQARAHVRPPRNRK